MTIADSGYRTRNGSREFSLKHYTLLTFNKSLQRIKQPLGFCRVSLWSDCVFQWINRSGQFPTARRW